MIYFLRSATACENPDILKMVQILDAIVDIPEFCTLLNKKSSFSPLIKRDCDDFCLLVQLVT